MHQIWRLAAFCVLLFGAVVLGGVTTGYAAGEQEQHEVPFT